MLLLLLPSGEGPSSAFVVQTDFTGTAGASVAAATSPPSPTVGTWNVGDSYSAGQSSFVFDATGTRAKNATSGSICHLQWTQTANTNFTTTLTLRGLSGSSGFATYYPLETTDGNFNVNNVSLYSLRLIVSGGNVTLETFNFSTEATTSDTLGAVDTSLTLTVLGNVASDILSIYVGTTLLRTFTAAGLSTSATKHVLSSDVASSGIEFDALSMTNTLDVPSAESTVRVGGIVRRPVREIRPAMRKRRALLVTSRRAGVQGGDPILNATASVVVTATADLAIPKPLAASVTVAITATAALTVAKPLAAAATLAITGTAALTVPKPLSAAATVTVTGAADLGIPGSGAALGAGAAVGVTAVGSLAAVVDLAAAAGFSITATATITGAVVVTPLRGVVTWRSDAAPAVAWNPRATPVVAWDPAAAPATVWTSTLKRRYGRPDN